MATAPRALEHRHVSCCFDALVEVVVRVTDDFPLADVEAFYPVVDLLGRVCQVSLGDLGGKSFGDHESFCMLLLNGIPLAATLL